MSISVSFTTIQLPSNRQQSLVTIAIQNLEGTLGTAGAWGLTGLNINGLHTDPATMGGASGTTTETPSGPVMLVGSATKTASPLNPPGTPTGGWSGLWDVKPENATGKGFVRREEPYGGYPIMGCTAPPMTAWGTYYTSSAGYFQTCGNGAVLYSFVAGWDLEFAPQTTLTVSGYGPGGQRFSCTFDVTCVSSTTVSATPEPGTIVLVASGLIGVGGVQRRRRRRRIA